FQKQVHAGVITQHLDILRGNSFGAKKLETFAIAVIKVPVEDQFETPLVGAGRGDIGGEQQAARVEPVIKKAKQLFAGAIRQVVKQAGAIDEIKLSRAGEVFGADRVFQQLMDGASDQVDRHVAAILLLFLRKGRGSVLEGFVVEIQQREFGVVAQVALLEE